MEQTTLQEILAVEKELQGKLDDEHEKASHWLEAERREIEAAHISGMAQLRELAEQGIDAARQSARAKAAEIIRQADDAARAVDLVPDAELRRLVLPRIAVIFPGTSSAR
jgi:hypothetical protein